MQQLLAHTVLLPEGGGGWVKVHQSHFRLSVGKKMESQEAKAYFCHLLLNDKRNYIKKYIQEHNHQMRKPFGNGNTES